MDDWKKLHFLLLISFGSIRVRRPAMTFCVCDMKFFTLQSFHSNSIERNILAGLQPCFPLVYFT